MMNIKDKIGELLMKYISYPCDDFLLQAIIPELERCVAVDLNREDLLNFISFEFYLKDNGSTNLIQAGNLFTLMAIHTNTVPPLLLLPNKGKGKDSFEWNGFRYSFVYDNSGQITANIDIL